MIKGKLHEKVYIGCHHFIFLIIWNLNEHQQGKYYTFKSLIELMGISYIPNEWRLFIDSSKKSIKAVLLYNGNTIGYIKLWYSVNMNES